MKLLTLPGDGIGPEVTNAALRVLDRLGLAVSVDEADVGGVSIDRHGTPLTEEAFARAAGADAILFGAVGGPAWEDRARRDRPEQGLLRLRRELGLYANLRPARVHAALLKHGPLKRRRATGTDVLFVRELTGGVYFGEPRGQTGVAPERRALDSQVYDEGEIARVAHVAFGLARGRRGRVHSVEKANVMETGQLWRAVVTEVGRDYPDVALTHMFADNAAMQLVLAPTQFDVIVTDNLFGDLLSDLAGALVGSLGLLPSAALGEGPPGRTRGLYEPIHGSAPDIAGRGKANPVGAILSLAMALRFSLGAPEMAERIERAVDGAIAGGARTADLGGELSTEAMTDAVLERL